MSRFVSSRAALLAVVAIGLLATGGWLGFPESVDAQAPAAPAAAPHQGHQMTAPAVSAAVPAASAISAPAGRVLGAESDLGNGVVASYAELDGQGVPAVVGIVFSAGALASLPAEGSDFHHCFDKNQDGTIDRATECVHTFEHVLPLPDAVSRRKDVPFKWVLLNWNPHGHIPPGIYDLPHFDVHFFMEPIAKVFALKAGGCGPELMNCEQFAIAKQAVPSNYIHPDFKDVDGVVPAMGNHLVDLTGPEFQKQPFTRSWIFGAYAGRITFYEEMVAHKTLLSTTESCSPIKQPRGVATAGYYPTVSCLRHDPATGQTTVSMERFTFRAASAPEP
jgi:hypothetical protein